MSRISEREELLEIYKLHSELADRVSQRRAGANKLCASLMTALIGGLVVLFRFGGDDLPLGEILIGVSLFGIALNTSWVIIIRSYRQLNSGKFKALHEMEEKLTYPFFKKEWVFLEGKYTPLTVAETFLAYTFYGAFTVILVVGVTSLLCRLT